MLPLGHVSRVVARRIRISWSCCLARLRAVLPLNFPPLTWKFLVGEPVTVDDVRGVDLLSFQVVDDIKALAEQKGALDLQAVSGVGLTPSVEFVRAACEASLPWLCAAKPTLSVCLAAPAWICVLFSQASRRRSSTK